MSPRPPQSEVQAPGTRTDAVAVELQALGVDIVRDAPLAPLTTYRVGGAAAVMALPSDAAQLAAIGSVSSAHGVPTLVIGRGSNLLVADEGFAGVAIGLGQMTRDTDIDIDIERCIVRADATVALPVLARRTVGAGLAGFEWAVGVPGSVGGGVRMNAGGHGSDVAASIIDADVCDLVSGLVATLTADQLGLGFRSSALEDRHVVLSARLQLRPGDSATGESLLAEIVRWRRDNQPGGHNAGSVFVNPVPGEVAAGALIDSLGLRGLRIGGAEVSTKHANFIQADEGARAADVKAVMDTVRRAVAASTGYVLRSEVRLVGFVDADGGTAGHGHS